jgi:hypothetical protein
MGWFRKTSNAPEKVRSYKDLKGEANLGNNLLAELNRIDAEFMQEYQIETKGITTLSRAHNVVLETERLIEQLKVNEGKLAQFEAATAKVDKTYNAEALKEVQKIAKIKDGIEKEILKEVGSLYVHIDYLKKVAKRMNKLESIEIKDNTGINKLITRAENQLKTYKKIVTDHNMLTKYEWSGKGIRAATA